MAEAVDYFDNHRLKLRFPWSLYHGPLVRALRGEVRAGERVLNVGAGPFFELERLPRGARYTACDIDPRAVEAARRLHAGRLERADVITAGAPLPYPAGSFDLVVAMDVIEHVVEPGPWLEELVRVTAPGGRLLVTTPNYGSRLLRVIEGTALEIVARAQGFSRKGLHPTKFDAARLERTLAAAGLVEVRVERISFGWVLAGRARKPA